MQDKRIPVDLLNRMDGHFAGFCSWLAGQFDPVTGGFYYARSSRRTGAFVPDIESTAQALNILIRLGLLQTMPEPMRQGMIRFFQSRQDPGSGYFHDEHPAMKKDDVMVHRALSYASGALRRLGSAPLYPLPLTARAAPDYVATPQTYLNKWRSIDLSNSWRGCDLLAGTCVYIGELPESLRGPFLREAASFLEHIQDPETGLWGEGSLYVRISGTFKLHTFYSRFNHSMPRTDRIYQSILHGLRNETAVDMCYIRNPIHLLSYIDRSIPSSDLQDILAVTVRNMGSLKREDGGFSREIGRSPAAPNVAQVKEGETYPDMPEPVVLSRGEVEGDMNASTQAVLIRQLSYRLAGLSDKPLPQTGDFYKQIRFE